MNTVYMFLIPYFILIYKEKVFLGFFIINIFKTSWYNIRLKEKLQK